MPGQSGGNFNYFICNWTGLPLRKHWANWNWENEGEISGKCFLLCISRLSAQSTRHWAQEYTCPFPAWWSKLNLEARWFCNCRFVCWAIWLSPSKSLERPLVLETSKCTHSLGAWCLWCVIVLCDGGVWGWADNRQKVDPQICGWMRGNSFSCKLSQLWRL